MKHADRVERDASALEIQRDALSPRFPDIAVEFVRGDFTKPLDLPVLDGTVDSTYLAGTNACVDAVLAHPRIEASVRAFRDGITIASDRLNPMPVLARP